MKRGMSDRLIQLFCGVLLLLSAAGCQPTRHADFAAFVREPRPSVVGRDYRIGVPDELVVTMMCDRGVEEVAQTLGPDGHLRLNGFGVVPAAGRTCAQITEDLNEIAQTTPAITSLAVRVKTFASQKVFVFGQVDSAGSQPYHGTNSVLDVVAAAKPNLRADVKHIQILRPSPDGEFRRKLTVDLDAMVRGGDTTLDVVLAGGDVVFVPPTTLGSIGLTFQQLFGQTTTPATQADITPREVVARPSVQTPASLPTVAGNSLTADPPTLAKFAEVDELAELRKVLSALTVELQAQRAADTARMAAWEAQHAAGQVSAAVPLQQVVFESRGRGFEVTHQESPTPAQGAYPTPTVQRGGAGESVRPEGVRFWGP